VYFVEVKIKSWNYKMNLLNLTEKEKQQIIGFFRKAESCPKNIFTISSPMTRTFSCSGTDAMKP